MGDVQLADRLYYGWVGAVIGVIFGAPVGFVLGVVMAFWLLLVQPTRKAIHWTITTLSVIVAFLVMWLFDLEALFLGPQFLSLVLPLIVLITWFGLPLVLRPSRPDREVVSLDVRSVNWAETADSER